MYEDETSKDEPWEDETNYSEDNDTITNSDDEEDTITDSPEETTVAEDHQELDVNKKKNFLQYSIGFVIRSVIAIIFSIFALKFILPSNSSDVFYKLYFVLFIVFELGVLTCYVFANRSIFLLQSFSKSITENKGRYSSLNSNNKKVNDVCTAYKKSFLVSDDEDYHKTRANSDLYFGPETWLQDTNPLPLQAFLKIIPGTFIGFGILGTFIGFAGGLSSINISDSQSLLDSVQQLLNGLRNAFNTSIVGMLASMFCNFVLIHPLFNKLDSVSKEFCDYLDNQFYVTEVDAMAIIDENNNKIPFPVVLTQILTRLEGVSSNINSMGLTIGDQVTKSVKETLDKTIEKIIKEENENQNSKTNSKNSNINSEELNQITKEIEDININETKKEDSISSISEEDEYIYTNKKENLDEIKQDFLNNKEAKDFLNNRGKINNNKNYYYTTINGQLNNPNNPFIETKDILYSE